MRLLILVLIQLPWAAALACSCGEVALVREVVPADGATDFPVDGHLRIFLTGGYPEEIRARLGEEYRLRGPTGLVPFDARLARTRLDLIPRTPLAPDTRYVLETVSAYDDQGWRMDDTMRLYQEVEKRYWFQAVAFTTGRQAGAAPGALSAVSFEAKVYDDSGMCGDGTIVSAAWPVQPLGPFEILELETQADGLVETAPRPYTRSGDHRISGGTSVCDPDPEVLRPGPIAARVTVVGPSGLRTSTPWHPQATLADGKGRSKPGHTMKRAWFGDVETDPAPPALPGPPGCEHGLEAVPGGPWPAREDPSVKVEDDWKQDTTTLISRGPPAWSEVLSTRSDGSKLAVCGDRLAVVWSDRGRTRRDESRMRWVVMDTGGRTIARSPADFNEPWLTYRLLCHGDGFLWVRWVDWNPISPRLRFLSRDGALQEWSELFAEAQVFDARPFRDGSALALTRNPYGMENFRGSQPGLHLIFLARDGTPGEPIMVTHDPPQGAQLMPMGDRLAVYWEARARSFVAVVDAEGRQTEPLSVGDFYNDVDVQVTPEGLLARTRESQWQERVEAIRCRKVPAATAPFRIEL